MAETSTDQLTPREHNIPEQNPRILSVPEQQRAAEVATNMWGQEADFQVTVNVESAHTKLLLDALHNGQITEDEFLTTIASRYAENRVASQMDFLTDHYNRAGGERRIEEALSMGHRMKTPTSAIMIDLDNFKGTNDVLGHIAGDSVLKAAADHIKTSIRPYDIPIRYGGDEFLVVLPNTTTEDGVGVANRIGNEAPGAITAVSELLDYHLPKPITFSVGLAEEIPNEGTEIDLEERAQELTRKADTAAKVAKFLGKNRVVLAKEIKGKTLYLDLGTNQVYDPIIENEKIVDPNPINNG